MAFNVTPTGGGGPYTYTSEIADKNKFDNGYYRLEFAVLSGEEACPTGPEGGNINQEAAASLLDTDEWVREDSYATQRCWTAVLRVVRNTDNFIMDYMIASVDRIV